MNCRYISVPVIYLLLSCTGTYSNDSMNMRVLSNMNLHSADGLYSACWGYTAPNGREYAILGCWKGTSFVDISDTNNIHEAGYIPGLNSCCREMKTFSHYAYVVADGIPNGLQIIDLQYLPDSVSLVNTFFFQGFTMGHTISQEGPYLYIHAGNYSSAGVFILDITDPVHPVKRGEFEEQVIHDSRVINDTIWACNIYNPPGTISVIDARNKDNLVKIAEWVNAPNPGPHNIAISADRKFAYVTDEINGNPRLLKIWNISNLSNVTFVSSWQPTGITTSIIHNVELYSNYLFAAHYTAGIRVINVSNPELPVEAAYYDTYPDNNGFTYDGCWGTYVFPSQKIICSDRSTGLYVLRTSFNIYNPPSQTPVNFYLKQNYPNPFNISTKIEFGLPNEGFVSVILYDVSGKQVSVLYDSFALAGTKIISFDGAKLASGVYFCVMNVDYTVNSISKNYIEARKIVLVK